MPPIRMPLNYGVEICNFSNMVSRAIMKLLPNFIQNFTVILSNLVVGHIYLEYL